MDATPNYMHYPERIHAIYQQHGTANTVKIIFVLREAVSRELSWYNHRVRDYKRHPRKALVWLKQGIVESGRLLSFEQTMNRTVVPELLKPNPADYQRQRPETLAGLYEPLLARVRLFDRRTQVLVLSYDEIQSDPAAFQHRLFDFLGIAKPDADTTSVLPVRNVATKRGAPPKPPCSVLRNLSSLFEPFNEALYILLDRHPGPDMEQRPFSRFKVPCSDNKG